MNYYLLVCEIATDTDNYPIIPVIGTSLSDAISKIPTGYSYVRQYGIIPVSTPKRTPQE